MNKEAFYNIISKDQVFDLSGQLNTPSYVYYSEIIETQLNRIKKVFKEIFQIHYAVKANPNKKILQKFSELNLGADVASEGELRYVLEEGFDRRKIEFSGPGKSDSELKFALTEKIGSVNVESLQEIRKIAKIAAKMKLKANLSIRVNPKEPGNKAGLKMAGETQFGIPENQIAEAVQLLRENQEQFNFKGLHFHYGSQILDAEALVNNIRNSLDFAAFFERRYKLKIQKINFGGGWGISYFLKQKALDIEKVSKKIYNLVQSGKYRALCKRAQMIIEPGRYLVAECGLYLSKVLYRKRSSGKQFAIVDGGMNHNYLLAGGMGQVIRRNFEIDICPADRRTVRDEYELTIAGPLCTPQDVLATNLRLQIDVKPDDIVIFFNCGAYGLTASPTGFLSHGLPDEIFVE